VYLTYPFVLSWSLLEAMSTGCAIIASDTPPVREVIEDGKTGELIDFLDVNGLAKKVIHLLENPKLRQELGARARQFAIENYDLETHCLPAQLKWVDSLLNKK
jgi:glycosyltransferase involved in cell wall biosynthesis